MYTSFIELDTENPYSRAYFGNINKFKEFYNYTLKANENELLHPQVNYADELNKYKNNISLFSIEKYQYEVYSFRIFLNYQYNQFDMWQLYYESLNAFVNNIATYSNGILQESSLKFEEYNNEYAIRDGSNNFLTANKVQGIKAKLKDGRFEWYLVKEDGTPALTDPTNADLEQEQKYVSLIKLEVDSYDCIILYTYLLEIECLRQNKLYIADENVTHVNYEISTSLHYYYNNINLLFKNTQTGVATGLTPVSNIFIPTSLMWDTSNFNDPEFINEFIEKYADREQGFESSLMNKLVGIYEDLGWAFPSMHEKAGKFFKFD
jgi:hypothetical protein